MRRAWLLSAALILGCAGADTGSTGGQPDVHAHPIRVTLEVTPQSIEVGQRATLDWTARNALQLSLTQNGADLPLGTSSVTSGSIVVSPGETTEYVLVGHGAAGRTAEAKAVLTVEAAAAGGDAAPIIKEFTASPDSVGRDDEVLLSWNVSGADNLRLTAGGETVELEDPSAAVGSTRHVPGASTTYRLTALNAHGESAVEAHVTVPLAILEASVSPAMVAPGGDATVRFRVQSAGAVVLTTDREGDAAIDAEIGADGRGEAVVTGIVGRTGLTLTASDDEGSVEWRAEVGVNVPEIFELTATPQAPGIDEDVEIAWRIDGADAVQITAVGPSGREREVEVGGASPAEGSVMDRPGDSTTYRLVATGRQGESEAEVAVTMPVAVVELALVGSPAILGGDVTVEYRVQGADAVEVSFGDRPGLEGAIAPDGRGAVEIEGVREAGTVTVTASRGDDSAERQAELGLAAPAILTFEASADAAGPDEPVRLSWDVLGAERLRLMAAPDEAGDPVEIDIAGEGLRRGGVSVRPFVPTSYMLTASNAAGDVFEEVAIDVRPTVVRLEAVPARPVYGGDTVVHFRVHGVGACLIDGQPVAFDVEGRGAHPVLGVTDPVTVELTAIGPDAQVVEELEIRAAPPAIPSFEAAPGDPGIDDEVAISWQVEGATELSLTAEPAEGDAYDVDLGQDPPAEGEVRLTPGVTTTFTLTATNPEGEARAQAAVTVPLRVLELELLGSPATLGGSVELRARIQGAVLAEVTAGGRAALPLDLDAEGRGAVVIEDIRADTEIRLEAFDHEGAVVGRQLQARLAQPEIVSFAADPVQGGADVDVVLAWDVAGAESLALTARPQGGEELEVGLQEGLPGDVTVRPSRTTAYALTATNAAGEAIARLTVPVPLAFLEFAIEGAPVVPGGTVTVRYRVQGAASVEATISGGERVERPLGPDGRGAFDIADVQSPLVVDVFAIDGVGREESRRGAVELAGPTVVAFVAQPDPVHPGEGASLAWTTERANTVRIERLDAEGGVEHSAEYGGDDAAQGSHPTVGLLRATTFRLVATGAGDLQETSEIEVGVVRDPTGLRLSEVFYDADSTDGGHEWIELRNEGPNPINLADVLIGHGGGSFNRNLEVLPDRIVPSGGCVVVGGPAVDERSFAQAYDVELDFTPDLQNSGAAADGVALYNAAQGPPDDGTAPFDSVLYGPVVDVDDSFVGVDGQLRVAPDVHDVGPAISIVRDGEGAWFELEIDPTPGRCFGLPVRDFTEGDSQLFLGQRRGSVFGGDAVGLRTFGLTAADDGVQVLFGGVAGTCFDDPSGIFCLTPAGSGEADLTLTGPGGHVVYPAFFAYQRISLCQIVDYDLDEVPAGLPFDGEALVSTPGGLAPEELLVESGWGPLGSDPSLTPELWTWTPIAHLERREDGKDRFGGRQDAPLDPGEYARTFRAAPTSDVFTYCADSPLVYSAELLGSFTVTEAVPQ